MCPRNLCIRYGATRVPGYSCLSGRGRLVPRRSVHPPSTATRRPWSIRARRRIGVTCRKSMASRSPAVVDNPAGRWGRRFCVGSCTRCAAVGHRPPSTARREQARVHSAAFRLVGRHPATKRSPALRLSVFLRRSQERIAHSLGVPEANVRHDPQAVPPIGPRDVAAGLLSLVNRRLIPPSVDLTPVRRGHPSGTPHTPQALTRPRRPPTTIPHPHFGTHRRRWRGTRPR